jgi:CRP-like cAMP-binding protein
MQRRDYADGELIVAQGDPSDSVYRILSGGVEIFSELEGHEVVLGSMTQGDFLGEMGIVEGRMRSASARANGPVAAELLGRWEFFQLISEDSSTAFTLINRLGDRLRAVSEKLARAEVSREADPTRPPETSIATHAKLRAQLFAASKPLRSFIPADGLEVADLPFSVGRRNGGRTGPASGVQLPLPDSKPFRLSRQHFALALIEDRYAVVDLGSTLGTRVNGEGLGQDFGRDFRHLDAGENEIVAGGSDSPFAFRVVLGEASS